jgi:uncharacterized membrane protein YedE/YeeE
MMAAFALACGLVFGLGLIVGGMADPARVASFLDLAGRWDPALAFVLAGAVTVASLGFAAASRRGLTLAGVPLQLPPTRPVDARLLAGALIFGIGWGLAGVCPGPAFVLVGAGVPAAGVFVGAMALGWVLVERWPREAAK